MKRIILNLYFTYILFFILLLKTLFALQGTFQQDGGAQPPVPVLGAAAGQGDISTYLDI